LKRDPLDQLKLVDEAVEPRREFADALYTRMSRALALMMTATGRETAMQQPKEASIRMGLPYTDMGAAVRFLTGVLGMRVLKFWGPEDNPIFAYLAYRESIISIAVRPPADNPWSAVGPVSIGINEPDEDLITQAYERAVAAGVEILRELGRSSNPAVQDYLGFTIRDFEGNLWDMASKRWTYDG
jgi:hypothetical protein